MDDPYLKKLYSMVNEAYESSMENLITGGRACGKTTKMFEQAFAAAKNPGDRVMMLRSDGQEHGIRNVTPKEEEQK